MMEMKEIMEEKEEIQPQEMNHHQLYVIPFLLLLLSYLSSSPVIGSLIYSLGKFFRKIKNIKL
jgi:hypothetical protein